MNRAFEVLWGCIALYSLGMGIFYSFKYGIGESYMFFIIATVAFIFFYVRRKNRLKAGDGQNN